MPFLSILEKQNKEDRVVFDIASGSVGAAAITIGKGKKPQIDYVKRIPIPTKERVHAKTLEVETLNAIKELAGDLVKEKKIAKKVSLVFSSPWHDSHTKITSIKKNESFTVSESFINEIVEEETEKIENEQRDNLELIESKVANVKINGYSTLSPAGKTANRVDLSLYVSMVPVSFRKKIEEEIEKRFSVKNFTYHSFPFACINTIEKIFYEDKNFLFMDIAGEITDVVSVKDSAIVGSASFPVGINTLIRKISDKFKINADLATSFAKLYGEKKADEDLSLQIEKLSNAVKEEWLAYFYQIASDLYGDTTTHKIFLTSDDAVAGVASSFLKELSTVTVFLGDKTLSEFCNIANHVQHDSFLTIESIYLSGF